MGWARMQNMNKDRINIACNHEIDGYMIATLLMPEMYGFAPEFSNTIRNIVCEFVVLVYVMPPKYRLASAK